MRSNICYCSKFDEVEKLADAFSMFSAFLAVEKAIEKERILANSQQVHLTFFLIFLHA